MPNTLLFSINSEGKIYALPTGSSTWREFLYLGLEFKRISAVHHFMWAIGGDRQVYVHVYGLDVPIRVKEEVYENERWYPIEGFSNKLLPTDRFHYSSQDGTVNREIDNIRCPSMAWQWESDWQLELQHEGQPLDHDGWTYAIDFPATFSSQKQWKSCVRRRKWFRYRKYCALNSWCAIAPLHKDPTEEPFIDIAIGNYRPDITENLAVWAVTSNGRVVWRSAVSLTSPEGLRWTIVKTPQGCEVSQISVGCTGLVWCSLYNGRALVRTGVTRDNLMGTNWLEVKAPEPGAKITCVSVGRNSVWCITNGGKVWWRKGVKSEQCGENEDAAIGNTWVEIFGNMSFLGLTQNDKVFAIGAEDRAIYFRAGVSSCDPTGKKWKQIQCPMQMSRTSSINSMGSRKSDSPNTKHKSMGYLLKDESFHNYDETSRSAPNQNAKYKPELWKKPYQSPPINEEDCAVSAPEKVIEHFETRRTRKSISPVRSVGSVLACEARPDSDIFDCDSSRDSGLFAEDDIDHYGSTWTVDNHTWTMIAAGALAIESNLLPNWFSETNSASQTAEYVQPWRLEIVKNLKQRIHNQQLFQSYEKAIELSSWVKSGEAKVSKQGKPYEDCLIELEYIDSADTNGSGTLCVLSSDGIVIKLQVSLSEIMYVASCSEPNIPRLVIHMPKMAVHYVKFQFSSESELEDWLSHLTSVYCQINGRGSTVSTPSKDTVWATTVLGDVFTFDSSLLSSQQYDETEKLFKREIELSATDSPYTIPLYNAMGKGTSLEILGYIYPDADYIRFDLQSYPTIRQRQTERNIALHINPRFNEKMVVLNNMDKSMWQDENRFVNDVGFNPGSEFSLKIKSEADGYHIDIDSKPFAVFAHRSDPTGVINLFSSGRVKIFKIQYYSDSVIMCPSDMFWRQIGGHMKKVETNADGVTWGISYDNTPYIYTGGCGGAFLKGLENNTTGIYPQTDTQNYYVYENQRWNPISGFSSTGLPTDRHCWSDVTGKHKRQKEHVKVLSTHWHWTSDWLIDFHTPGGVDREGWQYAVDFPASYHGKKNFTDVVRRRRWYRKCQLATSGPWQEVGNTKVADISLCGSYLWAIAMNGEILLRKNVTKSTPAGLNYEHIATETPMVSICANSDNEVWSCSKSGSIFRRLGGTCDKPEGEAWLKVDGNGIIFKQVSIGKGGCWAIDQFGKLYNRREITTVYPEGTHWQQVINLCTDVNHYDGNLNFKHVSVGNYVWAVTSSGFIFKRVENASQSNPEYGWNVGIPASFQHICAKAL